MSWMEEWRKQYERQREARRAAKFNPEALVKVPTGPATALEEIRVTIYEQEKKYANRWAFLDSIATMGRKHDPKESSETADAQRKRAKARTGGTDAAGAEGEPPEPVA